MLWRKPFSRQQTDFLNISKLEHRSWKPLKKWNSPAIQGMRKNGYVCGGATENVYRRVRVPFPSLWRVDWYVAQLWLFIKMVFEDTTAKRDLLTSLPWNTREKDILFLWALLKRPNCRSPIDWWHCHESKVTFQLGKLRSWGQEHNEGGKGGGIIREPNHYGCPGKSLQCHKCFL